MYSYVNSKIKVPFHLPNPNACQSGVICPVNSGDRNTYTISAPVLPEYPKVFFIYLLFKNHSF